MNSKQKTKNFRIKLINMLPTKLLYLINALSMRLLFPWQRIANANPVFFHPYHDFFHFIISLSFFHFLHHSQASLHPHFDNTTDQDSLLSFKSSIIDPNGALDSWNPNTSFCSWNGVLCNPIKQRVIGLQLGNQSLIGTINPHITNLSFLQFLGLQNNSFHGEIPEEIHLLKRLKILVLSSNNISGSIPPSLSLCSKLQSLRLSDNHIQSKIPFELGFLSELTGLSLDQNHISGIIPSSFGNLSSLLGLNLASNNIEGSIPSELGRLRNLEYLQLWDNNISGMIPYELLNISSLIYLITTRNNISGNLPFDLFTAFPNLEYLLMGENRLYGHIPSSLSNATNLKQFELSTNGFSGKMPQFWNLGKIELVNLIKNQLTNEGEDGWEFITSLANLTNLFQFSVAGNRLTGQIPSTIGNLSSKLNYLYMGHNQLSGEIPPEIGNLGGLALLSLESSFFTGKIPSSIGNLGNLQILFLPLNFLSGSIPETFGNLSKLFHLQLGKNNLTGEIPPSLSKCSNLQILVLIGNGLSGKIPKSIFSITSLRQLAIASNNLTGFLPSEIGNLKRIELLDISHNQLSGVIPTAIGECSNFIDMDLSNNYFQGPIPSSLTKLKSIEVIDFSSNNLSGTIPPLDSLIFLQYLNISMNMLEGEVPKNGIFLNTSGIFLSGNNKLCGGIPELRLPKCTAPETDSPSRDSHKKLIIGLVVGVVVVVSIILSLFLFLCIKRRKQPYSNSMEVISFDGPHKVYSYYELKSGTEDFSDRNLIGRGSFGSVYKGVMKDGTLAAIKVLNLDQRGAIKSFLSECEAFRNIRHRNLVKMFSVCSSPEFKALVLQFMPNGSLETWLHRRGDGKEKSKRGLSLKERIDIAIDVASAMEYLHHECETPIVHCDLKPSNVLLDENMVAHVSDFGLARMLQNHDNLSNQQQSSTIGLKGSIGYIAPEYGFGVGASTKGDVYSYGILVLEMFTGRSPSAEMFNGGLNLQRWVASALPNKVIDILDEDLKEVVVAQTIDHLISIINIGLKCANESQDERSEMKEVSASFKKVQALIFQ